LAKTPVVICVDDEPTVLESLKIELRRNLVGKCLIETAEDGMETLTLLNELMQEEYEIAVVVADYIMPKLRGDELLHQVRRLSPQTMNIMLSGQADLDAVGRSIQYASLYRFVAKPWHTDDLKLTITEAIQCYRQNQKILEKNEETQRLLREIRKLNSTLENQVQERTAQLNQSLQELRELGMLKDDFLHAISHDLRTPVAGMLLVLKKLQTKQTDAVAIERSILDRMVTGCERQLQMLENLLEAHSSELNGLRLQLDQHSLPTLIQEVLAELTPLAEANQVTLEMAIEPNLPPLLIDPQQLRRVFENLITNAIKHNMPGISILLTAQRQDHLIHCSVKDNGIGMTQRDCEVMFERYRQGNRIRRATGIGLGLYISRQIILEHGGEIGATSCPGEGVEVWFSLPIDQPNSPSSQSSNPELPNLKV
jgi:two-component system, sensor histidine kinase and response regulator